MPKSNVKVAILATKNDQGDNKYKLTLIEPMNELPDPQVLMMRGVYEMLQDKKFRLKAICMGRKKLN